MARKQSTLGRRGDIFAATRKESPPEPPAPPAEPRIKRTYHLPPAAVLALEEMQLERHRASGQKPELSDLVAEAILQLRHGHPDELPS